MLFRSKKIRERCVMNNLLKGLLFLFIFLNINMSFAHSDTEPELKLFRFMPTDLTIYLPMESTVEKHIYDYYQREKGLEYDVFYKGIPIIIGDFTQLLRFDDDTGIETRVNLEEVKFFYDDENKYIDNECYSRTCSNSNFRTGSIYDNEYSSHFKYPSSTAYERKIGKEFIASLFLYSNDKVKAVDPDSTINHGPYYIDIKFDPNSAIVPPEYYNDIAKFAEFINENDKVRVYIEGHTDKVEILISNKTIREYSFELSNERAEVIKTLLVGKYNVNSDRIKKISAEKYSRPVANNETEEGRQMNRRVEAYIQ